MNIHEPTTNLEAKCTPNQKKPSCTSRQALGLGLGLGLAACGGSDDSGSLSVLLEAEDVIIEGLEPGDDAENVRDGWSVGFDAYVVVIGDIDVYFASDASIEAENPDLYAVDLTQLPAAGLPLWPLDGLRAGRWQFGYTIAGAGDGATRHDSVSEDDFESMQDDDATYLVRGTLERDDGVSCPPAALAAPLDAAVDAGSNDGGDACYENPAIDFTLAASAETSFGLCEIDGVPGFSVPSGGTQTVAVTIHGDHLFFNGFPEGDEGGTLRLAQWLADCDLDLDGAVTRDELEGIRPADLSEIDDRFQLGAPPIPIESMWDYVVAQLKTQGHFQGEGECQVDGAAHGHDDE
jgi:hypothetical protein